ncbi:MAG: penicillin acylase family protein [Alphaproteobacteria bacterium]|nr:penicillin acylase family protein [Alphaproteobacteria bacterium]
MFPSRRGRRGRIALPPLLLILLTLLTLGVVFGGWQWLKTSLPMTEGDVKTLGLSQPATIARDRHGVPFIQAQTEADAYFALGYAHAQDRLWQMDLQRRIASGRLSEIAGKAGLSNDRFFRVLGLESKVESSFAALDEPVRQILLSYAAGVNAWIAGLDFNRQPPLEFLLAGIHPKPWRPSDSLLWPRVMALQLAGNWREELLSLNLIQQLGFERANDLTPMSAPSLQPVASLSASRLLAGLPPLSTPQLASNAWVLAGNRTSSGKPLLANDPHLNFQAPILWYLASLEAPGLSVKGGTVPGSPFVFLGQNKHVAWGLTSSHTDTMDLFVERPDTDGDKSRYMTPDGPAPYSVRREIISIKGEADMPFDIRETRHGPVISDVLSEREAPSDAIFSLAGTFLNPADKTPEALRKMSLAQNSVDFLQALALFQAPAQYVAYAADDGNIGLVQTGLVPLRAGNASPDMPRPGSDGSADWKGFIPANALPALHNPADGALSNANNRLAPEDYPHHLASNWPDNLRAGRISELLAAKTQHGPDDMSAYQMDSLSAAFLLLKPHLLTVSPPGLDGKKALGMVADWDGSMARDLPEPLIFAAWAEEIQRGLFADELRTADKKEPDRLFNAWSHALKPQLIAKTLSDNNVWCDNVATKDQTEDCQEIVTRALEEALRRLSRDFGADMAKWKWGTAHRAKFPHGILERLPLPESWIAPSIETDGDGSSLNRGTYAFGNFRHVHGAGLRAVYDLHDPANSRFIIASGQSGNPLSRHYDDLLKMWREGSYLKLDGRGKAEELVLWPAPVGN